MQPLDGEDVWMHPPRHRIAEAIRRLQICEGVGTILVPYDRTVMWWPLVAPGARGTVKVTRADGPSFQRRRVFKRKRGLLRRRERLLPKGYRDLLAVRLDFRPTNTTRTLPYELSREMADLSLREMDEV